MTNTTLYNSEVFFHIPIFFNTDIYNSNYIYHTIQDSQYNNGNIKLIGYGCPNNCTWNGGRLMIGPQYPINELERMILFYIQRLDMKLQFTLTNFLLEKRDIYDRYGNVLLDLADAYDIEILVCSDILEDHIRNRYPNMRIARSIINTKEIDKDDFEKYSTIVVSKYKNKDMDYLKSLVKLRDSLNKNTTFELLADEPCALNCPRRARTHYEAYNMTQLHIQHTKPLNCTMSDDKCTHKQIEILPEQINDYINIGMNHIKLSGRENITHFIETTVNYLIRPECQRDIRMFSYENMSRMIYTYKEMQSEYR